MQNKRSLVFLICLLISSGFSFAKTFKYADKTVDIKKISGSWDYEHVLIKYKNGDVFKGHADNNLNLIKGELIYNKSKTVYTGTFNNNQPDGQGKKVLKDGTVYDGHWEDGKFRGRGVKLCPDGSRIEGNFISDDLISGKDSFIQWANGASYKGETEDGVFNGSGKYTFEDGTVYEGEFIDNMRTGFGRTTYNGSSYTGYYYGDVRNRLGDFKFYNGYEYKGNFFEGTFSGTGYLLAEEDEKVIYASDCWDGAQIPEEGKIIFEDGLVWEGSIKGGIPVAGKGIWTTQEQRLAKIREMNSNCELVSYGINDKSIIVASVFTEEEKAQLMQSVNYLRDFKDFYKAHRPTFDKIIKGMQLVADVLATTPSPIQPFAIAVSIGLAAVDISLKSLEPGFDVYAALKAGNKSIIKDIARNYGKDIAFDVLEIILMGQAANVLGNVEEALEKSKMSPEMVQLIMLAFVRAGDYISKACSSVMDENKEMSDLEVFLKSLKPVRELNEAGLMQQGNRLRESVM